MAREPLFEGKSSKGWKELKLHVDIHSTTRCYSGMIYTFQHVLREKRCIAWVVHANTHLMKRPSDLFLVTRAPSTKRRFLDGIQCCRYQTTFLHQLTIANEKLPQFSSQRPSKKKRNFRTKQENPYLTTKQAGELMLSFLHSFALLSLLRPTTFYEINSSCYTPEEKESEALS